MKKWIWIPVLSGFVAALASSAVLYLHPGQRGKGCPIDDKSWLVRELKLTPEQVKKLADIQQTYGQSLSSCRQQHGSARCQIADEIFRPDITDAQLDATAEALSRATMEGERATLKYFRAVHAMLTPEQKKKYEQFVMSCVCNCNTKSDGASCADNCCSHHAGEKGAP